MSNVINNKVPPVPEIMSQMPTMFSANKDHAPVISTSTHSFQTRKIDFPPTNMRGDR